ncbi:MAG: hypothetical protein F6K47_19830 [Symploca sp. SIO2E6]|nr:hypothetical protein [Symploca sp. SIO2E6]
MFYSYLQQLIEKLYHQVNGAEPDKNAKTMINELVESNGLASDEFSSSWLVHFFELLLEAKSTDKIDINYDKEKKADGEDIFNFLAELEDVIKMECYDSGEEIEMIFRSLGVYALISVESGFYQIQSADAPDCASYAAEKLFNTNND